MNPNRSLFAACLLASASLAHAAPFTNGSFEVGTDPGAGFSTLPTGSTAITGWTVTSGDIDYIGGYWQAGSGSRSVDMVGCSQGTIAQTFDTIAGESYRVDFLMAGNPDGPPTVKTLSVDAAGVTSSFSFDVTGASRPNMRWSERSFGFTATGSSTTLRFTNTSSNSGCAGSALDDVRVTRTVEVPVGGAPWLLLLGFGVLGLLAWHSRRA